MLEVLLLVAILGHFSSKLVTVGTMIESLTLARAEEATKTPGL